MHCRAAGAAAVSNSPASRPAGWSSLVLLAGTPSETGNCQATMTSTQRSCLVQGIWGMASLSRWLVELLVRTLQLLPFKEIVGWAVSPSRLALKCLCANVDDPAGNPSPCREGKIPEQGLWRMPTSTNTSTLQVVKHKVALGFG